MAGRERDRLPDSSRTRPCQGSISLVGVTRLSRSILQPVYLNGAGLGQSKGCLPVLSDPFYSDIGIEESSKTGQHGGIETFNNHSGFGLARRRTAAFNNIRLAMPR